MMMISPAYKIMNSWDTSTLPLLASCTQKKSYFPIANSQNFRGAHVLKFVIGLEKRKKYTPGENSEQMWALLLSCHPYTSSLGLKRSWASCSHMQSRVNLIWRLETTRWLDEAIFFSFFHWRITLREKTTRGQKCCHNEIECCKICYY